MAERDAWDKADVIAKIVAGLFLPIALLLLGNWYNEQQKTLEDRKLKTEGQASRLTSMLKHLSSENARERLLATKVAEYFVQHDQLPGELVAVLYTLANSDPNKEVSSSAAQSLTAAAQSKATPLAAKALAGLPSRVYLHILREDQRGQAAEVSRTLQQSGVSVPGVERVSVSLKNNQLRYFHPEDRAEAERIAKVLADAQVPNVTMQIGGYEAKVASRQFEVWLK